MGTWGFIGTLFFIEMVLLYLTEPLEALPSVVIMVSGLLVSAFIISKLPKDFLHKKLTDK